MTYTNAELLAPAGTPESLDAAIGEGADAVYLGLKTFNARMRTGNFSYNQFEAAVESVHKMGKRLYVTVNTVFEQREADRMYQFLQYLEKVGPDGIIVQDFGVLKMASDHFPGLRIHASTQMNVGTAAGANYLSRFGLKRIVLPRELSLDEIRDVRANTNMELQTFVHGALCVSASGVCLFSSYLGGRSANRGACTQACRRLYREESQDGYFFSPDDMQLVDKLPELVEAGVCSFKIEGRMKSSEYVGTVVAAYRYMLDNWRFDRERASTKAAAILQGDFARRKTTFWFEGVVDPGYIRPEQAGGTGIALGKIKVVRVFEDKRWMLVKTFEGIAEGDSIRIHSHDDSGRLTARVKGVMTKVEGLYIQVEAEFGPEDEIYLVQTKSLSRRYKPILPSSLAKYHKFPSYDSAPRPEFPVIPHDRLAALPDGLYAMVSRVQDLHTIQADRPQKAMLRLDRKNAELLRRHEHETPFKRDSLILWLEPFFPQGDAAWLAEELDYWMERGQKIFVVNNLGHLALLKGKGATVIAGPWLYAFNAWAAAFILGNGADFLVPPLEIAKQSYGRMSEFVPNKCIIPVVFAYPQLFTIRGDLGKRYDFRYFKDRDGDDYELVSSPDSTVVVPAKPFSLVDRIPYLHKDGVTKYIVDFSFMDLKKQIYKRVMAAARDGVVLPQTGRFNWKDGFWNPEEAMTPKNADSGDRAAESERPAGPGRRGVARGEGRSEGQSDGRSDTRGAARSGTSGRMEKPARGQRATASGRPAWEGSPARGRPTGRIRDEATRSDASRSPRGDRPSRPAAPSRPSSAGRSSKVDGSTSSSPRAAGSTDRPPRSTSRSPRAASSTGRPARSASGREGGPSGRDGAASGSIRKTPKDSPREKSGSGARDKRPGRSRE